MTEVAFTRHGCASSSSHDITSSSVHLSCRALFRSLGISHAHVEHYVSGRKVSRKIWNAAHYFDKVSKPRLATARLRLCTSVTQTTRTDGMRSMGRAVPTRSIRYSCGLCCVRRRFLPKGRPDFLPRFVFCGSTMSWWCCVHNHTR